MTRREGLTTVYRGLPASVYVVYRRQDSDHFGRKALLVVGMALSALFLALVTALLMFALSGAGSAQQKPVAADS